MLYLLGVNLPDHKQVPTALTHIYGIGIHQAQKICHKLAIHPRCRLAHLPEQKVTEISQLLNTYKIEAELRRERSNRIEQLVQIGCYRGDRHKHGYPANGQRTRPNGKTAKKLNGRSLSVRSRGFCTSLPLASTTSTPRVPSPPSISSTLAPITRLIARFI
ncbi:hypothetical protein HK097_008538 [Rhizophlyctis rosea]|uniref:Ribosomal protein S13 n=1 Tax=Rhizophlyctis rosea TaxID=64517 RepID=A0AAD5X3W7_9FUNG|nr:hypothetical protein HK097_008538 [Rhizophlyctis rosea]